MKESVRRAWDNKTAQKYYFYEDQRRFKMNYKIFQKWVNVIVFPENIKLIDAIEVIQKYIEMEA